MPEQPEVLFNLQDILNEMVVTKRTANRAKLESDKYQAAVSLTWDDKKKTWLLTMFEKKNSALSNTTDTDKTHVGIGNDTATPESTVISDHKDTKMTDNEQRTDEKSHESDDKNAPTLQKKVEIAATEINTCFFVRVKEICPKVHWGAE